jgi:uncharacterized membrane protein YfcA
MELTSSQYCLVFIVTFIGELYGSVLGGGGFLIQPFLISLGISPYIVVANDVVASTGTSFGSYLVYRNKKLIRWELVRSIAPGLICGNILGIYFLHSVSPVFIEKFVALVALIFLGSTLMPKAETGISERALPKHAKTKLGFFGLVIGIYVTFSGAGAGTFGTYILTRVFGTTFLQALALQAVLSFLIIPFALAGYIYLDLIQIRLLIVMLCATSLAGIYGAKIAVFAGDRWLKPAFSIAVLGFACYLLAR